MNQPGSMVSVTGAGAWQTSQPSAISAGIGKYTESSTIHETQPSVSVFGSTPTTSHSRLGSQESIASSTRQQQQQSQLNRKTDSQMTIIESGYSSADEPQQRTSQFRPKSSTIIEEPSTTHHGESQSGIAGLIGGPGSVIMSSNDIQLREQPIYENLRTDLSSSISESDLDPFSYEQFIYDYFSTHARRLRADDGTLVLLIDGQQIRMSHIRLPPTDNLTLAKNVYIDAIDEFPPPFETELDQLVIFIHGEPIVLPADRWSFYKRKFHRAQWINNLDRVNRRLPTQLMPIIEQWLADHTTFILDINEMSVDGLNIPLIGKSGAHILDLYQVRQLQSTESFFWSEILKYLIRSGYVSFDAEDKVVHIAQSELDAQRLLSARSSPSPELIERLASLLRAMENIHFDNARGRLILGESFVLSHEQIADLFEKYQRGESLNATELASRLLHIADVDEAQDGRSLIISLDDQTLTLTPTAPPPPPPSALSTSDIQEQDSQLSEEPLRQWFSENILWSAEQDGAFLIRYRQMPEYVIRVTGQDGLRLSNRLQQQTLQLDDLLDWHENHVQIDRTENGLRMIIKPNRNLEVVNLSVEQNEKGREKAYEEKRRPTNEKTRKKIEEEEKNLVFFIPLHQQTSSDNEQEEKEKEKEKNHHYQHSTSPSAVVQREEQRKVKSNRDDDDEDDVGKERALFLQSIASLLHFVNANGSDVGTLELVQGRRLRLTLAGNSQLSQQQQYLEFDEQDTRILCEDLQLDIDACTAHLVDHTFENLRFDSNQENLLISYRGQMLKLKNLKQKFFQPSAKKLRLSSNKNGKGDAKTIDEEHVTAITTWLDQLNREQLITITEQNDIVILPNGEDDQEQQILISHDDVDLYMENKLKNAKPEEQSEVIGMNDIARIILSYDYVRYAAGQCNLWQSTCRSGSKRIILVTIDHSRRSPGRTESRNRGRSFRWRTHTSAPSSLRTHATDQ